MKVRTTYTVEFDTDSDSSPRSIMAAARALRTLIDDIDPGLTVFLQRLQYDDVDADLTFLLPENITRLGENFLSILRAATNESK